MNNNNTKLQFTKLTPDDVAKHEDLYIASCLALNNFYLPSEYFDNYHNHAAKELQKAKEMFSRAFE